MNSSEYISRTNINYSCSQGSPKMQTIQRQGDWICLHCNNLNFSFRKKCNRCKMQTREENQQLIAYYTMSSEWTFPALALQDRTNRPDSQNFSDTQIQVEHAKQTKYKPKYHQKQKWCEKQNTSQSSRKPSSTSSQQLSQTYLNPELEHQQSSLFSSTQLIVDPLQSWIEESDCLKLENFNCLDWNFRQSQDQILCLDWISCPFYILEEQSNQIKQDQFIIDFEIQQMVNKLVI